jgi:hypothetical protein
MTVSLLNRFDGWTVGWWEWCCVEGWGLGGVLCSPAVCLRQYGVGTKSWHPPSGL